jgi:surfeit locus 1 family protein
MSRRLRPALWPTLAVLPALALLLYLGTWQVQRLDWKTRLIADVEAGLAAPPVALPDSVDPQALRALEWRQVRVAGRFRHDLERRLVGRTMAGRLGVDLVTPLERDDGPPVLVNRGFVPEGAGEAARRPDGRVTLVGVVRLEPEPGPFTPDNRPQANQWYTVDIAGMAAGLPRPALPVWLQAVPDAGPAAPPVPRPPRPDLRNPHLGYAVTWYGLAAALVGVYLAFSLRRTGP